ncbi:MAG: type II toxin-antitoxin system PemK/MazF family toxin [Pyramidobacter sp.]|nr:type II toxin-antitoxin system PemK/MazF family toxin [Pyramidobacter sp.]
MRRGDLVTVAIQGDYGKPRPALVIQSDTLMDHPSITVLPLTSYLLPTPLLRVTISPNEQNGLLKKSQVMVDKIITLPREKLGPVIGHVTEDELAEISNRLLLLLDLQ